MEEIEKVPGFYTLFEAKDLERKMETVITSESSLKRDWLRPEEDEAWRDL